MFGTVYAHLNKFSFWFSQSQTIHAEIRKFIRNYLQLCGEQIHQPTGLTLGAWAMSRPTYMYILMREEAKFIFYHYLWYSKKLITWTEKSFRTFESQENWKRKQASD